MKRIAIPMIALMAGGILAAQITPQAAQSVQSQARTAAKSAQSTPASASAAKSPTPAVKPAPAVKHSTPATSKPTAQSAAQAKPSAITPAAGKPVTTAAQSKKAPVPTSPVKVTPAAATVKTTAPKGAPHVAAPKPAVQKAAKVEPKVKEAMVKTESPAPEPKPVINLTSRRDPFTSPVTRALAVNQGPGCSTGKRCLAVDQMILRGIVRSPNGMIAVVENGAKRAYFLRENDPVWHGTVVKINGDSVVFREDTVDSKTGKASTHEVVKRVNAPVV